jgi:hypothetical protein
MKTKLFFLGCVIAGAAPLPAVVTPEIDYTVNGATNTHNLSWYGTAAHTYFIQHSLDLVVWTTVPVIEEGNNAPLSWSMQLATARTFFRVLASDLPTNGDPETADFDGDGLNNLLEVTIGSNPISLDSDKDGMPDAWEYQYGFSLTVPGGAGNADGDALSELAEFLVGGNPNVIDPSTTAATFNLVVTAP